MVEMLYAHNGTIDPETGYLENKAYPFAFDAKKKQEFISCLVTNGLGIYEACEALGIERNTFIKHYHKDPQFQKDFDEAKMEYTARLDAVSKRNALNPKSVIERIFQLKALLPQVYNDQKNSGTINVTVSVDPNLLQNVNKRQDILEIEELPSDIKT